MTSAHPDRVGTTGSWFSKRTTRLRGVLATVLALIAVTLEDGAAWPQEGRAAPRYIEGDSVRVVFWEGDALSARRTLEAALSPLPLPGIPGSMRRPVGTIYLAHSPEVFDSLTLGGVPSWAAGVAIPSLQRIILPAYDRGPGLGDAVVTLRHEMAHLALRRHVGEGPRWFDEGYATWVSGGLDERSGWQIRLALLGGTLPPLDSLRLSWPRSESRARLSYLLSASAVRYLATSRSDRAFAAFLERWRQEGSFDTAMREVYLLTPEQFEREWRTMVRRRYGWLLAISQVGVFWAGFAVLVIILGTLRRRRDRERLEELRKEEYMLPPGPPSGVDPETDQP